MQAMTEANKVLGKDIKVLGVGNDELAKVCTPSLSTFNYAFDLTGEKAVKMLLDLIANKQAEVSKLVMGFESVSRQSC